MAEKKSTPELDRVRRLAQHATELANLVDEELRSHITEGHKPLGT